MHLLAVEADMSSLLCRVAEVSAAALQGMNPLVKVTVHEGALDSKDLSYVQLYQVQSLHLKAHAAISMPGCCQASAASFALFTLMDLNGYGAL